MNQQVKVKISIGKFEDYMFCGIIPMEVCHVLLRRPWQFDKKTMHNYLTNEITFSHREHKFVFHPLTPIQVIEDQVRMKRKKIKREKKKKVHKTLKKY